MQAYQIDRIGISDCAISFFVITNHGQSTDNSCAPIYQHGLALISSKIDNYAQNKVWDEKIIPQIERFVRMVQICSVIKNIIIKQC